MANIAISAMSAADALTGDELVEVSQLSSTVTITAATISALASDNSFNDSGSGFVSAGFAIGDRVNASGFTGNAANNIRVGVVTDLTAGKMTIGGTDGDVIVDDAAGESVTISKWESRRATASEIAALAGATTTLDDLSDTNIYEPADGDRLVWDESAGAWVNEANPAAANQVVTILVTDPNGSAITTGDGKAYYRVPSTLNGLNLVAVAASLTTVSSSGTPTIQIHNATDAQDMLSTRITIDANEKDSKDATAAAAIDTAHDDVATGDQLRIDVDVAGTGAKGLIVEMQFA